MQRRTTRSSSRVCVGLSRISMGSTSAMLTNLHRSKNRGNFMLSTLRVDLLSGPVLYQTPDDSETAPVGVNWWVVSDRGSLSTAQLVAPLNPMVLLCSTCSAFRPCSFDNGCVEGACQCRNGESWLLYLRPTCCRGYLMSSSCLRCS